MKVRLIDTPEIERVATWLGEPRNYKWLDFGSGQQVLSAVSLKLMAIRPAHCLRVFTPDDSTEPIGIVALSDIDRRFRKATLWYVLGDKCYAGRGYTSRAVASLLDLAFTELGLQSVYAWAVEDNAPSIRVLERNGFGLIGRRRQCHSIDDQLRDRLLFDILASEYRRSDGV